MSLQSKINDILVHLCKVNNVSLDCIEQWTVEPYLDVTNRYIPVMVCILSDHSLVGKEEAEDKICDILIDLAHRGVNWRNFVSKIQKASVKPNLEEDLYKL